MELAERIGLITLAAVVLGFGVQGTLDWTWFFTGLGVPALLAAGWVAGRGSRPATWRHVPYRLATGPARRARSHRPACRCAARRRLADLAPAALVSAGRQCHQPRRRAGGPKRRPVLAAPVRGVRRSSNSSAVIRRWPPPTSDEERGSSRTIRRHGRAGAVLAFSAGMAASSRLPALQQVHDLDLSGDPRRAAERQAAGGSRAPPGVGGRLAQRTARAVSIRRASGGPPTARSRSPRSRNP